MRYVFLITLHLFAFFKFTKWKRDIASRNKQLIILSLAEFIYNYFTNLKHTCSGKTVQWGKQEPLSYEYQGQKYIAAIDRAYSEAARKLLEVLMKENDLMGRLRSVKSYFLLAQGDFVVSSVFM